MQAIATTQNKMSGTIMDFICAEKIRRTIEAYGLCMCAIEVWPINFLWQLQTINYYNPTDFLNATEAAVSVPFHLLKHGGCGEGKSHDLMHVSMVSVLK